VQLGGIHLEQVEGHDFHARGVQPATCRRTRDATLNSAIHVLCSSHKFPKAVVIPILSACRGNHAPIIVPPECRSTVGDRTAGSDEPRCRQLAHKSAECRGRQHGSKKASSPESVGESRLRGRIERKLIITRVSGRRSRRSTWTSLGIVNTLCRSQ
jgi:hypothetical protein